MPDQKRKPTDEQQAAIDAYLTGENLVLEAGAGTGKTSTLRMMAEATPNRRILYLAFNRSVAEEARDTFGRNVECRTSDSMAYRAVIGNRRSRLSGPRQKANDVADILAIPHGGRVDGLRLHRTSLGKAVTACVTKWCRTTDERFLNRHVGDIDVLAAHEDRAEIRRVVLRYARLAWADLLSDNGKLRLTHAHLFKQWVLEKPLLDYDCIFFDEAQDTDELTMHVVQSQTMQIVAVGDESQAIYGWRGATSAMNAFGGNRVQLTQSWRFGQEIADEANVWLKLLGANIRLRGNPAVTSAVRAGRPGAHPRAVLCRSNGGIIRELLRAQDTGIAAGIPDDRKKAELIRTVTALGELWDGFHSRHPEFAAFKTWEELEQHVADDPDEQGLEVLMKLIVHYGHRKIVDALERSADAAHADMVICTAHIAKGLEWVTVRISDDFYPPGRDRRGIQKPLSRDEAMLAYVAVTRAKRVLDRGGLSWVHQMPHLTVA